MKIAVCDDDRISREQIVSLIKEQEPDIEVITFETWEDMFVSKESFAVSFLDVEMKPKSGMGVTQHIREEQKKRDNGKSIVIFVTEECEHMEKAYEMRAFHYLLKPIDEKKFRTVFKRVLKEVSAKTKRKKRNKQEIIINLESNQIIFDQKTLTEAIVNAYQIVEEQKMKKKIEEEEKVKKEWNKAIGKKEYPENEKWYLKSLHNVRNNLVILWNLFFFEPKNVRDLRATLTLMKVSVMGIFGLCKLCLYSISIIMIYTVFQNRVNMLPNIAMAFATWLFARVFRIASFEIDKMEDGNLLIAIFSGCISFVAMAIALITIFIG